MERVNFKLLEDKMDLEKELENLKLKLASSKPGRAGY